MTDIDRLVERLTKQRTIAEHRAELGDDWNGDYESAYDLMVMDCRAAAAALKEQQIEMATNFYKSAHAEGYAKGIEDAAEAHILAAAVSALKEGDK